MFFYPSFVPESGSQLPLVDVNSPGLVSCFRHGSMTTEAVAAAAVLCIFYVLYYYIHIIYWWFYFVLVLSTIGRFFPRKLRYESRPSTWNTGDMVWIFDQIRFLQTKWVARNWSRTMGTSESPHAWNECVSLRNGTVLTNLLLADFV